VEAWHLTWEEKRRFPKDQLHLVIKRENYRVLPETIIASRMVSANTSSSIGAGSGSGWPVLSESIACASLPFVDSLLILWV
jgi:hypothetical protein